MSEEIPTEAAGADGTQSIRRAAAILQRIARVSTGTQPTLADISASVGLSRSTTHRMLKSLVETRLASYDPVSRSYGIGLLAYELGLAVPDPTLGFSQLQLAVDRIARRTKATTYLMRRSGMEAVCVHKADGTSVVRVMPVLVGQRRLLGMGAGATALLAGLDDDFIATVMVALQRETPGFSAQSLVDLIAQTRQTGFSISQGRVYQSVYGLGIAIPAEGGPPEFAVSIAAHRSDVTDADIAAWKQILIDELGLAPHAA